MLLCQWLQEFGDSLKIVKIEADPCPNLMEQYKVCPFAEQQCIAVLCTRFSFCEDFIISSLAPMKVPVFLESIIKLILGIEGNLAGSFACRYMACRP
jgi:hypothetical protein